MKINKFNEQEIGKIKENIKYLNELLEDAHDEVIEFEIRKQIKYELSLLKTRINKYE
ncbi:hypothetical protein [Spiroplasma ixodetis]|uniref:hypothetical protein n=1 Tax=Spiroplasma ixodetis TaxID=2141 RepID=UPI002578157D|nr:hypothetical protein [Spiroplasma ixodetis]WJG69340.1 hypothetical protein SIXOD_v1c01830 [Spiroplasma ixodetis Y32]WJG70221.1 hypothetical protein SIXOD_v1c13040 [Spiroplasma ixodetis Y32]WJG70664.1 hypothetical protein SIXOD_v1c18710 [Spiroplasma ixodetis Y32]WJG71239.1 hypothetical protein SIXOD_v1c26160 [Spiroplasma ixodetis Y32]